MSSDLQNLDHIVFFDGYCNLCNATVDLLLKNDRRSIFHYASLQSKYAAMIPKKYAAENSVVYFRKGKFFIRSTAALELAKDLGGFWKLFYVLKWVPVPIRDAVYRFIAKYRYSVFGKRDICRVPTEKERGFFLD